jgi:hypothetical protein
MKDHSEQSPDVEYDCLGETVRAADYCIITCSLSAISVKSRYSLHL